MKIRTGNMWSVEKEADLFLFTSNGVLNRGMLVMGGGFAKQMLNNVSTSLPKVLGRASERRGYPHNGNIYKYGLLISENWPTIKWGAFQTKLHYRDETPLSVVRESAKLLSDWALRHPDKKVHCNFPGIGLGGRTYREILPIIQVIPDNVTFWTMDNWRDRPHYKNMPKEFYRKVDRITGGEDPDQVLMYPISSMPLNPFWEHKMEQAGTFSYMFDEDGREMVMAHTSSYHGKPREDLYLYEAIGEKLAVAIMLDSNHFTVQSLMNSDGRIIWTSPPRYMQTLEDCLSVFPQYEGLEYGLPE